MYVELPAVGTELKAGSTFGVVESVKARGGATGGLAPRPAALTSRAGRLGRLQPHLRHGAGDEQHAGGRCVERELLSCAVTEGGRRAGLRQHRPFRRRLDDEGEAVQARGGGGADGRIRLLCALRGRWPLGGLRQHKSDSARGGERRRCMPQPEAAHTTMASLLGLSLCCMRRRARSIHTGWRCNVRCNAHTGPRARARIARLQGGVIYIYITKSLLAAPCLSVCVLLFNSPDAWLAPRPPRAARRSARTDSGRAGVGPVRLPSGCDRTNTERAGSSRGLLLGRREGMCRRRRPDTVTH